MKPVEFTCEGCGVEVITYRWINYRTVPPSRDDRDLCEACKRYQDTPLRGSDVPQ